MMVGVVRVVEVQGDLRQVVGFVRQRELTRIFAAVHPVRNPRRGPFKLDHRLLHHRLPSQPRERDGLWTGCASSPNAPAPVCLTSHRPGLSPGTSHLLKLHRVGNYVQFRKIFSAIVDTLMLAKRPTGQRSTPIGLQREGQTRGKAGRFGQDSTCASPESCPPLSARSILRTCSAVSAGNLRPHLKADNEDQRS